MRAGTDQVQAGNVRIPVVRAEPGRLAERRREREGGAEAGADILRAVIAGLRQKVAVPNA